VGIPNLWVSQTLALVRRRRVSGLKGVGGRVPKKENPGSLAADGGLIRG
jgi:hypothetical protein